MSRGLPCSPRRCRGGMTGATSRLVARACHGALGSAAPTALRKHGILLTQVSGAGAGEEEVLVLGNAASEIVTGRALAAVLASAHAYERDVLAALAAGISAPPIVQHTAAAAPAQVGGFIDALEAHLLPHGPGWCVSLQVEGATAVNAGVELLLHLQAARGFSGRASVAVADRSYHGPPGTSFGNPATPVGAVHSATKPTQLTYPAPHPWRAAELGAAGLGRALEAEWDAFFTRHAGAVGAVLVEPQWGSACCAATWPPELLRTFICRAHDAGALVLADEVMCALGRHAARSANGRAACFLSSAWGLDIDALTFGKAVGAGAYPLSGAVLLRGGEEIGRAGGALGQSHTYAAASPRALLAATAVLDALRTEWAEMIDAASAVLGDAVTAAAAAGAGRMHAQGHGLMRGLLIDPALPAAERAAAMTALEARCREARVVPYFIRASAGVIITPPYDAPLVMLREAGERLAVAVGRVADDMGWRPPEARAADSSRMAGAPAALRRQLPGLGPS